MGRRGEVGMEVGGRGAIIYLSLHCHHQNDFCIKMGSEESHFNVSVGSDGQSHRTVSINPSLFNLSLSSFVHRYVEGFPSKRTVMKVDLL